MDSYGSRPWLAQYPPALPQDITPEFRSMLDLFQATVVRSPERDAVRYFDGRISFSQLDALSDAFALGLLRAGHAPGDRVALYLQNVPQYLIAQLGTWKAGGATVSINPMNKQRELAELLGDSQATTLVTLRSLHRAVAAEVVPGTAVRTVITTTPELYQTRGVERVLDLSAETRSDGTLDFEDFITPHLGSVLPPRTVPADVLAVLTYTSGTTGPPKGAMAMHRHLVLGAQAYRDLVRLDDTDCILGVAPLFHVTGLTGHIAVSLLVGAPLVLTCRFEADTVLEAIDREGVTFTVGSITVFMALLEAAERVGTGLPSLRKVLSGGAPIPPAAVRRFEERFGVYIHNVYGLTETTYPSHAVPMGARAPVDAASGALSVGLPVPGAVVRVLDDAGREVPVGDVGELAVRSSQVTSGYWRKPAETASALPDGELRTGDVGFMDAEGWFYVVDRKKDQINAGGYKVWPREVEDVLYEHPAVREAAVIGVPDAYRGETVHAFVSVKATHTVTSAELVEFAKRRLAAYKYPRRVDIVENIPKTASGKVLRRELRSAVSGGDSAATGEALR